MQVLVIKKNWEHFLEYLLNLYFIQENPNWDKTL